MGQVAAMNGACPRGCVDTEGCGCEWNRTLEDRVAELESELKWVRDAMLNGIGNLALGLEQHTHELQANGRSYTTGSGRWVR